MRELAEKFKAMADETRLMMLALLLKRKELCVCDFVSVLEISQSKASRHLRILANSGFLSDRRDAVWVHYRISGGLDAESKVLIKSLNRLLDEDRVKDLTAKLESWLISKNSNSSCCSTGKSR